MNSPFLEAPVDPLEAAIRLGVAALIGLAVGIEREWSGHSGRFAGVRTFFILGILGGVAGLISLAGHVAEATVLLAGSAGLVIAALVGGMRNDAKRLDTTTEAAALAILGLGYLAAGGQLMIAAGIGALLVVALGEKKRLHGMVEKVGENELQAAGRFAVMAVVILPLLPDTDLPGGGDITARGLWTLVLLFSAINFLGYIAQRVVGPERGYGFAGLLGGVVSSTLVTLQFGRRSKAEPDQGAALALGAVAASTTLPPRLLAITAVLAPGVALASLPYLIPPTVVGVAIVGVVMYRSEGGEATLDKTRSPLHVVSSIRLALLFWVALIAINWLQGQFGDTGVLSSAVILGLTNMDALTVAMARLGEDGGAELAAKGIGIGVLSNTFFKIGVAAVVGSPLYRKWVAVGLVALGVALGVGLLV